MSDPLIDGFFNAFDGMSVEAVFTPEQGAERVIRVIFDRQSSDMTIGGMGIESAKPQATCRDVDIAGVTHGCKLTIGGQDWSITDIQPDGTGITVLILTR